MIWFRQAKDTQGAAWVLTVQLTWSIYMPTQPLVALGSWVPLWWASIWWWNGKVSKEAWFICRGKRQFWRSEGCEEQADVGSLLDTHLGRWQPGSMLISVTHVATKATGVPGILATTYSHFDVQGPCRHQGHIDLSGLCCHWGTWWHSGLHCYRGHIWVQGPAARVCADVHGFSNHKRQWGWPGSSQTPESLVVSKNRISTRAMLIWMGYAAIWGHRDIRAHAAMRGHVWVCGLATESELISMTPDITEGHANIQSLCCYLGSGDDLKGMLQPGLCRSEWPALHCEMAQDSALTPWEHHHSLSWVTYRYVS